MCSKKKKEYRQSLSSINIISEKINVKEWTDSFKELSNPPLTFRVQYNEPLHINYELDRNFTMDELLYVINKSKNNKQPGQNSIEVLQICHTSFFRKTSKHP